MNASSRVAVNTFAQYVRTIVSVVIALFTSRIVLANLGVDDYGINSVVGGVVAMLAFIQNNLARTIQRFLSYNRGKGDKNRQILIFNNSVWTQLIISIILCFGLLLLLPIVFTSIINIKPDRHNAAIVVYLFTILNLFFNMLITPYMAALISRENIVFSSIVSIFDSILKIPIALSLVWISSNKLEWYSCMGSVIVILNFLLYKFYCSRKYDECRHFTFQSFRRDMFKEMLSFMGWNVYGTMCITIRTQGVAIILNRFYTTAINAAYGIAGMVTGQLSFLSSSLTTAMNPQIIKAEGAGERNKMLRLTEISCKLSFLLMSIISVPAVFYMDIILDLWLQDVPEYSGLFCTFILLSVQIDLITQNCSTANQAVGNVKVYSIVINTIKALTLPFAYWALKAGYGPMGVMISYLFFEAVCAIGRLVFLHYNINLSVRQFFANVIVGITPPFIFNLVVCYFISYYQVPLMILVAMIASLVITSTITYLVGLKQDEKEIVKGMAVKLISKGKNGNDID